MNSELLKRKIKESPLTQEELAKKIRLSRPGLSKKINKRTNFTVNEAIKIMKIIRLSFDDFVEIFEDKK